MRKADKISVLGSLFHVHYTTGQAGNQEAPIFMNHPQFTSHQHQVLAGMNSYKFFKILQVF